MATVISFVKLFIIITAPVWILGLILIPIAAIISAVMRKDKSKGWKAVWIILTALLWVPGYIYGLVHFQNKVTRGITMFVVALVVLTAGGTIYYNYDRANGDVVKALAYYFEVPEQRSPDDPFFYGNYLPEELQDKYQPKTPQITTGSPTEPEQSTEPPPAAE